jgi:putative heme-binding domain-containing protein
VKPKPKVVITKPEAIDFNQLRKQKMRLVDSKIALDLLAKTLASTDNSGTQAALLKGMLSGLEGKRDIGSPKNWNLAKEHLSTSDNAEVKTQLQRLGQIFGEKDATNKAIATVRDSGAPADSRREALRSLITQKAPELKSILPVLLDDLGIQVDAIRAYSAIEDPKAASLLISRFPKMDSGARIATIETLATRKTYATSFLEALQSNTIPKAEIPAYVARNLTNLLGKEFTNFYGDIKSLSEDKAKLITKYKKLLTADRLSKADPHRGRLIFQTSCSVCHKLYDTGGIIGPDLTGSNRADLDYILLNMIDPSGDIADAYKLVTIKTKSGQVLTGTLSAEDDQRITLNMVGQKQIVIKSDIASREVSPYSMMPEGLLPTLQDEQVLDLVKYLQTTKQVELPK